MPISPGPLNTAARIPLLCPPRKTAFVTSRHARPSSSDTCARLLEFCRDSSARVLSGLVCSSSAGARLLEFCRGSSARVLPGLVCSGPVRLCGPRRAERQCSEQTVPWWRSRVVRRLFRSVSRRPASCPRSRPRAVVRRSPSGRLCLDVDVLLVLVEHHLLELLAALSSISFIWSPKSAFTAASGPITDISVLGSASVASGSNDGPAIA
jgi:hypothetical protein